MKEQSIIFTQDICRNIVSTLAEITYDKVFILVDERTNELCLPVIKGCDSLQEVTVIKIGAGDEHKTIESLSHVWQVLSEQHATRHSLLINLGGGMVTDLGGFAASTFKRGITFLNIPTTLLSMVDASAGGKTGINFNGLKNEIGVFRNAFEVLIDTIFLRTLDHDNICSGFAEMLKHSLISSHKDWVQLMQVDLNNPDQADWATLIEQSVSVKKRIVKADPEEHGLRKALNFGHTAGHAFESLSFSRQRPILHGYAVAFGLICELYLSCKQLDFPHDVLLKTAQFIKSHYGVFSFTCKEYDQLFELMTHDKKNTANHVNFTLLSDIGEIEINQTATKEAIFDMFDFYRETMGC